MGKGQHPPARLSSATSLYLTLAARAAGRREWERHVSLLRNAALLGDLNALARLGAWCVEGYRTSSGRVLVKRNARDGMAFLNHAASKGNANAAAILGTCYLGVPGVRRDGAVARRWFSLAARRGLSVGALNMAAMCDAASDYRAERRWLLRAKALGDPEAALWLARLSLLTGSRTAAKRAEAFLRQASQSKDTYTRVRARSLLEDSPVGQVAWHEVAGPPRKREKA